ncbi:unnamed protein product [Coregonus sp. 'balchen']|nr:unnamed protein product [Coregonus sp. 'balchen']
MTIPWRTGVMLMLMLLSSAEASLNEPVICYILDGVLILYSIITTVLFFKVKKHRQEASSDTYQALQVKDDESDAYQVIKSKGRTRKKDKAKKAQVLQDLSANTQTQTRPSAPPPPPH